MSNEDDEQDFVSVVNAIASTTFDGIDLNSEDENIVYENEVKTVPIVEEKASFAGNVGDRKNETPSPGPRIAEASPGHDLEQRENVHAWLASIDLGFLATPLISEGYDSMSRVSRLTMEDLLEMGVKRGYARTMLTSLERNTSQMRKDVTREIRRLCGAQKKVKASVRECKDALEGLDARETFLSGRVKRAFRKMHEALRARESELLKHLSIAIDRKRTQLTQQCDVLRGVDHTLKRNHAVAELTLDADRTTDEEFSRVSLAMLTKLRRLSSLSDVPIRPAETGKDVALYFRGSSTNQSDLSEVLRELRLTGRVIDLDASKCTVELYDHRTDTTTAIDGPVNVKVGVSSTLVVTTRDFAGVTLPYGGFDVGLLMYEMNATFDDDDVVHQQHLLTIANHVQDVEDHQDGTYAVQFSLPRRGTYNLFLTVNDVPIAQSPIWVEADADVQLTYISDFDTNGLFHFLGTKKVTRSYVNPCDAREVSVECSSLYHGRSSDAVDLHPADTYTKDEAGSWYCVDIGPTRRLAPTRYTLRNVTRSCAHAIRNWRLEASTDLKTWTLLSEHLNDMSMSTTSCATATFRVHDEAEENDEPRGFRYFCLTQTGPNAFGKHVLVLGGLELYGSLTDVGSSLPDARRSFTTPTRLRRHRRRMNGSASSRDRPAWSNEPISSPKIRSVMFTKGKGKRTF